MPRKPTAKKARVTGVAKALNDRLLPAEASLCPKSQREFVDCLSEIRKDRRPSRLTPDEVCSELGINKRTYMNTLRHQVGFARAVASEMASRGDELLHKLQQKALDLIESNSAENEDIDLALKIYKGVAPAARARQPVIAPGPHAQLFHDQPPTAEIEYDHDGDDGEDEDDPDDPLAMVKHIANKAMGQTNESLWKEREEHGEQAKAERLARGGGGEAPEVPRAEG